MSTQFYWNGAYVSSHDLLLDEFLPMAYKGLYSVGISPKDAEYYLKVIKDRIKGTNGSEWLIRNFRQLQNTHKPFEAMQVLTANLYKKQENGYPVSTWGMLHDGDELPFKKQRIVKHVMSSDIFSVSKNDSIELVLNIMKWKGIHHMPVINTDRELQGLISWTDVKAYLEASKKLKASVQKIMKTDIVTVHEYATLEEAKKIMDASAIGSLAVVNQNKLVGLITYNDL